MKSFANVTNLKPNVFILSIDSEDTYFSVPIHLEHQNYLFFFNKLYQFSIQLCV